MPKTSTYLDFSTRRTRVRYFGLLLYERLRQRLCSAQVAQYKCPMPKIHISLRMMIKRGHKPDRFSYQRVKTGEDESPGYWWRWVLRLGNCSLPFQSRL
ncbi:MAG: hypothetical protein RMX65_003400 [Nostoc sp. DedQUE01]|nr:hypothetical protein [Nostoc sp. DedQUE11]MDZ8072105.1 hypothetical protein [Nostoc sp. DedQUE01]MDZ8080368.1 hypothetical protein [Nostoc sp. DcaGUA01]